MRLDLNLGYAFKVHQKQQVRVILDVTNLLNSQTAATVDQRYNFSGLDVGQTNQYFKAPTTFQAPRSIRLGVRYSF
jgi:outer membrane receptor protein involved in Fe transport